MKTFCSIIQQQIESCTNIFLPFLNFLEASCKITDREVMTSGNATTGRIKTASKINKNVFFIFATISFIKINASLNFIVISTANPFVRKCGNII